jgi:hypothetical protein
LSTSRWPLSAAIEHVNSVCVSAFEVIGGLDT